MENKLSAIEKLLLSCLKDGPLAGRSLTVAMKDKYRARINYAAMYIKMHGLVEAGLVTSDDRIVGHRHVRIFTLTRAGEIAV